MARNVWHVTQSWHSFIPSRIGQSPCVDLAVKANVQSFGINREDRGITEDECFYSSMQATAALRSLMQTRTGGISDDALLTVALLFLFEHSVRPWSASRRVAPIDRNNVIHMKGLSAIFAARGAEIKCSALYRAIFYSTSFYTTFMLQIFSDHDLSPFEQVEWMELDPPPWNGSWDDHSTKLRKISNKLFILLLRLVRLIRRIRHGGDDNLKMSAVRVVQLVLALKDESSENQLLHTVSIVKTTADVDPDIVPYIFLFYSYTDFEAALAYWTTRLFTLRLCKRLASLTDSNLFKHTTLDDEASRTAKNVFMSWEQILSHGEALRLHGSVVYQSLWGALEQFDIPTKAAPDRVRSWILRRSNELSGDVCLLCEDHLDAFAELQCGGDVRNPNLAFIPKELAQPLSKTGAE